MYNERRKMKSPQEKADIRDLALDELRGRARSDGGEAVPGRPDLRLAPITRACRISPRFAGLSKDLREKLAARFRIGALEVADRRDSGDGTTKFLFRLHDGAFIETVLIPAGEDA